MYSACYVVTTGIFPSPPRAPCILLVLAAAAPGTLDHADQRGRTPLRTAAKKGNESTVRLSLSVGASEEAWMKNRESSLELAAQ